jgi:uncharacterized membrane protein YphA (DoxX/SURF4 family)
MNRIRPSIAIVARILIVAIFLANGLGIIDQPVPVREMIAREIPADLASLLVLVGRGIQIFAGLGLAFWRVSTNLRGRADHIPYSS